MILNRTKESATPNKLGNIEMEINKNKFVSLLRECKREGIEDLIDFLEDEEQSDFFLAPASTKYHGSYPGGLCVHSLNVYECLKSYLDTDRVKEGFKLKIPEESIILVALLHDICKTNVYKESTRNVKVDGKWTQVPYYEFEDKFPYGHGEKSVYMASKYIRLTDEEAMAIRYHMGFSGNETANQVGNAMHMYPLVLALATADMEATCFLEK